MFKGKHEQWIADGKKVWVIIDELKKRDLNNNVVLITTLSYSYGDSEDDAIKGTMLENPKGVEIVSRKFEQYQSESQIDKFIDASNAPFFIGYVK